MERAIQWPMYVAPTFASLCNADGILGGKLCSFVALARLDGAGNLAQISKRPARLRSRAATLGLFIGYRLPAKPRWPIRRLLAASEEAKPSN